jgi:putative addiction module component (TIGR02574 family)
MEALRPYRDSMSLTVDQIVEETRSWPEDRIALLVDRLRGRLGDVEPRGETSLRDEVCRRLAELERGEVQGIPGEEVSDRVRRMVGR